MLVPDYYTWNISYNLFKKLPSIYWTLITSLNVIVISFARCTTPTFFSFTTIRAPFVIAIFRIIIVTFSVVIKIVVGLIYVVVSSDAFVTCKVVCVGLHLMMVSSNRHHQSCLINPQHRLSITVLLMAFFIFIKLLLLFISFFTSLFILFHAIIMPLVTKQISFEQILSYKLLWVFLLRQLRIICQRAYFLELISWLVLFKSIYDIYL